MSRYSDTIQNRIEVNHIRTSKVDPFNTVKIRERKGTDVDIYIGSFGSNGKGSKGCFSIIMNHKGHEKLLQGCYRYTTRTRMELLAIIHALSALKLPKLKLCLHLQSEGVYLALKAREPWLWVRRYKKGFKNDDLWWQIIEKLKGHKYKCVLESENPDLLFSPRLEQMTRYQYWKGEIKSDSEYEKICGVYD